MKLKEMITDHNRKIEHLDKLLKKEVPSFADPMASKGTRIKRLKKEIREKHLLVLMALEEGKPGNRKEWDDGYSLDFEKNESEDKLTELIDKNDELIDKETELNYETAMMIVVYS